MNPAPTRTTRFGQSALATPANFVTLARIVVAVPTLALIADRGATWTTVTLWFVISVTDKLDGWLARRDGATRSGAFLDPIADKLIVLGGLTVLAADDLVPWLPVALIAAREIGVSIYRVALSRRGRSLPARPFGKWKATLQFLAVGIVLFPWLTDYDEVGVGAVWVAAALTIVSGVDLIHANAAD